jgi:Uma2 family endonuclease
MVMTVQEMKEKKREKGYTFEQIAARSGVPLGTVQKIFSGETKSPRYDTIAALEELFDDSEPMMVKESISAYNTSYQRGQGNYTIEDYYAVPEERRVELIDGSIYDMGAPTTTHQSIAAEIYRQIANFIIDEGGSCQPFIAPIDVQLDGDDRTVVQPDVIIVCNREKIKKQVIYGAPDFVLEVISPSSRQRDCVKKLGKYINAGVREYWMIDPDRRRIVTHLFDGDTDTAIFGFDQRIPVGIYGGRLKIDLMRISGWI